MASYLGIDVGGTKVCLRAEAAGTPAHSRTLHWRAGASVVEDLAELSAQLGRLPHPVRAAGVAMPATMDDEGRVTAWPTRPSWVGLDLVRAFGALLPGAQICWGDDGDLAALAESAAHHDDLLYVGVGTGIGGGLIHAGRNLPERGSCELGHVVVDRSGPRCDCGRSGCLQAVASGPATLRRAVQLHGSPVTADQLRQAWLDDEPWAVAAIRESCAAIAAAVVSVGELVRARLAVIGGGFAAALPGFVEEVSRQTEPLARAGHQAPEVRRSAHGGLASLQGAVLLARQAGRPR